MSLSTEILSILSLTETSSMSNLSQRLGASLRDLEAAVNQVNQGRTFITRTENDILMLSDVYETLCSEKIRAVLGLDADRLSLK